MSGAANTGGEGSGGDGPAKQSAALSDVMGLLRKREDAPTESSGGGGGKMICRRCGRRGHMGRNCMFADKCAICGKVGHYAKDCKGFLKAAKAIEGKQFAKQQAALRSAESARTMETLLNRSSGRGAVGAPTEPAWGAEARPTDFLSEAMAGGAAPGDGSRGSAGKKQPPPVAMRVRVIPAHGHQPKQQPKQQPSVWQSKPPAEGAKAGAQEDEGTDGEEDEGAQLGGLLAAYGSDSDDSDEGCGEEEGAKERVPKGGTPPEEPEEKRQRVAPPATALPSATDLLDGLGSDGADAGAAGSAGGSFLRRQLSGGESGFDRQESQRQVAMKERLAKDHRVLEVRRTGGSFLGEEITFKCTAEAGRFLLRHLGAVQRGTGAVVAAEKGGEDGVFRISRRPPAGDEAVRRAAAILGDAVGAFVDLVFEKKKQRGARGGEAAAAASSWSRTIDGVVFSLK